jgi:hypothetical protein
MATATATTNNTPPAFLDGPFPHPDLVRGVLQSFEVQDIAHCALVSKAWEKAMNAPGVWLTMFDNEKIPRIPSRADTVKEDFKFMSKITLSKRQAAPLGVFVGEVPPISESTFKFLKYGKDGFEPSKYNDKTHVVIVEPTHFIIPYDADFAQNFDDWFVVKAPFGNFEAEYRVAGYDIEIDDAKTQMKIPYSWFSMLKLAQRSWTKTDRLFDKDIDHVVSKIFKDTVKFSETVNVYIMRINPPEIVKEKKCIVQKQIMKSKGYEIARFTPRIYFNMIELLNKGKCPDGTLSMRTLDRVEFVDEDLSSGLGMKIFDRGNLGIGDVNALWQSAFPIIRIEDPSRTDDINAAAGFPAEPEVMKEPPAGSKRTHDTAFGPGS